ncbi:FxLYD domain-containing protein [Streptomyces sp. enrichment culture]|uniref:FxLYD domain-containing protein n=1 Tax=Streptomyces sp. enrichment culture TaxID=1795815 RepID=UPI003F55C937
MSGSPLRRAALAVPALLLVTVLTGCSDGDSPSDAVRKAASAAGRATEAWSSATAEAGRRFDEIKGGVDAKDAVKLGTPSAGGDGRATVEVTVRNDSDSAKTFAVQVDFTDKGGNRLDAVVVTVPDVPAGGSGKGTARSNRDLGGEIGAEVGRAVRY